MWSCSLQGVPFLSQCRNKQTYKVSYCKTVRPIKLLYSVSLTHLIFLFYRFDLNTMRTKTLTMAYSRYNSLTYLFRNSKTYFKFAVDENGLWVIYASNTGDNTMVAKLNPKAFTVEAIINTAYPTNKAGNAFIAYGVLYITDGMDRRVTYAFDLKTQSPLDASFDLRPTNGILAMLSYYPSRELLYMWDNSSVKTCKVEFKQSKI